MPSDNFLPQREELLTAMAAVPISSYPNTAAIASYTNSPAQPQQEWALLVGGSQADLQNQTVVDPESIVGFGRNLRASLLHDMDFSLDQAVDEASNEAEVNGQQQTPSSGQEPSLNDLGFPKSETQGNAKEANGVSHEARGMRREARGSATLENAIFWLPFPSSPLIRGIATAIFTCSRWCTERSSL